MKDDPTRAPRTLPIQSATFTNEINAEIRRAAATGIYDIRGGGAKRKLPHFDDLLSLWARDEYFPLVYSRQAVTEAAVHTLTLTPLSTPLSKLGFTESAHVKLS